MVKHSTLIAQCRSRYSSCTRLPTMYTIHEHSISRQVLWTRPPFGIVYLVTLVTGMHTSLTWTSSLTHGGETHSKGRPLSNLAEDLGLAILADVVGHLKVPKGACSKRNHCSLVSILDPSSLRPTMLSTCIMLNLALSYWDRTIFLLTKKRRLRCLFLPPGPFSQRLVSQGGEEENKMVYLDGIRTWDLLVYSWMLQPLGHGQQRTR